MERCRRRRDSSSDQKSSVRTCAASRSAASIACAARTCPRPRPEVSSRMRGRPGRRRRRGRPERRSQAQDERAEAAIVECRGACRLPMPGTPGRSKYPLPPECPALRRSSMMSSAARTAIYGICRQVLANFPGVRHVWLCARSSTPQENAMSRSQSTAGRSARYACLRAPAARLSRSARQATSRDDCERRLQAADRPGRQGCRLGADQRRTGRAHADNGRGHGRRPRLRPRRRRRQDRDRGGPGFRRPRRGRRVQPGPGQARAMLTRKPRASRNGARSSRATSSKPISARRRS